MAQHRLDEKTIFHIDVNSAFLSWSAVDALAKSPSSIDLRTVPSAVGGDRLSRHGVILAKSIPAKKYGIITGEAVAAALRKCPKLVLVSPDFFVYNKFSRAFIAVLKRYSPVVEQVSIDESYVDMSSMHMLYCSAETVARQIADEIRESLGFSVNVGISSNKLLAKMASDFEKPDKVHTLYPEEIEKKLWPLEVGELFGIGRSSSAKLKENGLKTIGDVAGCEVDFIKRILGDKNGLLVYNHANGIDDSEVSAVNSAPKGYGNSITLPQDMTADNEAEILKPTLLALCDSVASRLRRDNIKARTVCVQLKSSEFKNYSRRTTLDEAICSTDELYSVALKLFNELWNRSFPVRLIGVSTANLSCENVCQLSIFDNEELFKEKALHEKLDKATDEIRNRYGKGAVVRAALVDLGIAKGVGKKED